MTDDYTVLQICSRADPDKRTPGALVCADCACPIVASSESLAPTTNVCMECATERILNTAGIIGKDPT